MAEEKLCPTCFSELVSDEERERRIEEDPEYEIYGYSWSDDPILTPRGLSGEEYKGVTEIKIKHIIELQEARKQQEDDLGISGADKTEFTEFDGKVAVNYKHIRELRDSTEKILKEIAGIEELTAEERKELLYEYFNFDAEGNKIIPADSKYVDKDEWTDSALTKKIKIKGIHIEDLRHPISLLNWEETFDIQEDQEIYPRLNESGFWFGPFYPGTINYHYWNIPNFYGKHKWNQEYGGICPGKLESSIYTSGEVDFDLEQADSKLKYHFHAKSPGANSPDLFGSSHLRHCIKTEIDSNFRPSSVLELKDLSFTGDHSECLIKINTVLTVKELVSKNPTEYITTSVEKTLYFFTKLGEVHTWTWGPHITIDENGRLLLRYKSYREEGSYNWYPIEDIKVRIVDAINYQWNEDLRIMGESEEIGKRYINKIYIGNFSIFMLASSLFWYDGQYEGIATFSLDTIKFSRLLKGTG